MLLFCSSSSLALVAGNGGIFGNGKNRNKLKQRKKREKESSSCAIVHSFEGAEGGVVTGGGSLGARWMGGVLGGPGCGGL
jgi:hypothetical protein